MLRPPAIIRLLTESQVTWQMPVNGSKTIYLTFDDGPIPEITPKILDILRGYEVKATFFCVGDNVLKHPDIYQQILDEGHRTGNHSFNHINGWVTRTKDYVQNVEKAARLIDSDLFRPPYGRMKPTQIRALRKDYRIILWSALTGDYDQKISRRQCLHNAINTTDDGSIIVFHDNIKAKEKVYYALPRFIEHFLDEGFRFALL